MWWGGAFQGGPGAGGDQAQASRRHWECGGTARQVRQGHQGRRPLREEGREVGTEGGKRESKGERAVGGEGTGREAHLLLPTRAARPGLSRLRKSWRQLESQT